MSQLLEKYLLFTPGPVKVAATLRDAIFRQGICHREGVIKRFTRIKARAEPLRVGMRRLNLEFLIDAAAMCSVLTTVRVPPSVSVRSLRERLRDKSIIIYEGKVFQVGNIGELSDYDIRFFLAALKDVLLTLQAEAAELIAPVRLKSATPVMLPTPGQMREKVVS